MDLFDYEKLNQYKTKSDGLTAMSRRIRVNPLIAEYYVRLGEENFDMLKKRNVRKNRRGTGEDADEVVEIYKSFRDMMVKRSNRVLGCGRIIETTSFDRLKTHYIKTVKLCCDKFCGNCQKQLSNARERKYTPLLNLLAEHYDLYHITFTVPNVTGFFLKKAVDDIFRAYAKFTKIISGKKKIHGINFANLGYEGSLRSLEITMNERRSDYHPHLHCIFVFKKGLALDQPKVFTNPFSYNYGRKIQQFSAFEVLVQKLWYLCYEGKTVTKKALDELENGYSCIVNAADGNYHQIFKYAIKGLLDEQKAQMKKNKNKSPDEPLERGITYEIFEDLFFALENRRALQGYGCFYGLKLDESVLTDPDKTDEEVNALVKALRLVDYGCEKNEPLVEVLRNMIQKNEIYFSKRSVQQNLNSLKSED